MGYGLPRAAVPEAFTALRAIVDRTPFKIASPVEVRSTGNDDIEPSNGYGHDNVQPRDFGS